MDFWLNNAKTDERIKLVILEQRLSSGNTALQDK